MTNFAELLRRANLGRDVPLTVSRVETAYMVFSGSTALTPAITESEARAFLLGMIACVADFGFDQYAKTDWVAA